MNTAGIRAIKTALGNAEDNLTRARMQQGSDPDWRTGNDEPIGSLIAGYERERTDLAEALAEAESR